MKVLPVIFDLPSFQIAPAPRPLALLLEKMQSFTINVFEQHIAPPSIYAVLSVKLQPFKVNGPQLTIAPAKFAKLFLTTQSFNVKFPLFSIPPPSPFSLPFSIIKFCITTVVPELMMNTRPLLWAFIVALPLFSTLKFRFLLMEKPCSSKVAPFASIIVSPD